MYWTAVGKELEAKLEFWKQKQVEIETKFKEVYPTTKSCKGKAKKTKGKGSSANYPLSCYAATLIKEFFIKVSMTTFC